MKIGLVGKPNAGKSTFFTAATSASAQIGDYPFTTIDKNVGIAHVRKPCPSKELGVEPNPNNSLSINGTRYIPIEVIDVAGLVPGAHEGKGMGNKFLDDLRQADVLIQVVDSSGNTDLEGNSTEGANPVEEIEFLKKSTDAKHTLAAALLPGPAQADEDMKSLPIVDVQLATRRRKCTEMRNGAPLRYCVSSPKSTLLQTAPGSRTGNFGGISKGGNFREECGFVCILHIRLVKM